MVLIVSEIISINFLSSGHVAKDAVNSGEPATFSNGKKCENIYCLKKYQKTGDNIIYRYSYTVSGPTILNFIWTSRSIGNLSTMAGTFFEKLLLDKINKLDENDHIQIKIKGHSRGAIIAERVYNYLKLKFTSKQIEFISPIYLDPYAGPLSRLIRKNDQISQNDESTTVYTLNEHRFKTPANALKTKYIIFTKVAHDRCQFIKLTQEQKKNNSSGGVFYLHTNNGDEDTKLRDYKLKLRVLDKETKYLTDKSKNNSPETIIYEPIDLLNKKIQETKQWHNDYLNQNITKIENSDDINNCLNYFLKDKKIKVTNSRKNILIKKLKIAFSDAENAVENWLNQN